MTPKTDPVIHLGHNAGKSYFYDKFMSEGKMTTKTETLYRLKIITPWVQEAIDHNDLEPVQVHVAGDLFYKKYHQNGNYCDMEKFNKEKGNGISELNCMFDYEKVTHVLPDSHWLDVPRIIELQKKVEELNHTDISKNGIINSQEQEIKLLKDKLRLWESGEYIDANIRLKSELEEANREIKCGLSANKELAQLLEEAKKGGVVWNEVNVHPPCPNGAMETFTDERSLAVYWDGQRCVIPKPPQPRTVEEEAQEAFLKRYPTPIQNVDEKFEEFKAGFKARAVKEGAGE